MLSGEEGDNAQVFLRSRWIRTLHTLSTPEAPQIPRTGNVERINPRTRASGTHQSSPAIEATITSHIILKVKIICSMPLIPTFQHAETVLMCVQVHVCAYVGQRTTLAAVSQMLSVHLVYWDRVCGSPGRAGWLESPRSLPVLPSQIWDYKHVSKYPVQLYFFSVCVWGGRVLGLARHVLYRLSYLPSLFIYYLFETGLHCNTGQPQTLCVTMDVLEAPWGSRSHHHTLLQECFKSLTGILHKA